MKKVSIDDLNVHLFETIEMLKNNNDNTASEGEKISVDMAKAIADCAKVIIDGYKVKCQVLHYISKTDGFNENMLKAIANSSGINME